MRLTKIEAAARKPPTVSAGRAALVRRRAHARTVARARAGIASGRSAVRAGPPRLPSGPPPGRVRVIRIRHERRRLVGARLRLDRPVDDPAQVEDGDLHDHHQPDQLPHYGPSVALNSAGDRRLERPLDQRFSGRVELRHCEGCARARRAGFRGASRPGPGARRAPRRPPCSCPGRRRSSAHLEPARPTRRRVAAPLGHDRECRAAGRGGGRAGAVPTSPRTRAEGVPRAGSVPPSQE